MKLCLCVIFKNERNYLEECLKTVSSIIDEAVLVDSDSNDGSPEIAQKFCAGDPQRKYLVRPWPGNFSDQKNFAISHAKSEWILFLDADERIDIKDLSKIKAALELKDVKAYRLPIWNYTNDVTEWSFQPLPSGSPAKGMILTHLHRLFRNHPEIRYSGRLHERIEPSLQKVIGQCRDLDAPIHHLGKLKEVERGLLKQRYAFYEELGRKKIEDDPSDAQAYWELGSVLQKQGRFSEAERQFSNAERLDPEQELFESARMMTWLQMQDWKRLSESRARHSANEVFPLLAQAFFDPKCLARLESLTAPPYQLPLLLLELAMLHGDAARIEKYDTLSRERFGETGSVELVLAGLLNKRGNKAEAIFKYREALQKGQGKALEPLLVLLGSENRFQEAVALKYEHPQEFEFFVSEKTRALMARVEKLSPTIS